MNPTISKQELLERESRWSVPAGVASLLGVALFIGSVALQQSGGALQTDSDAERLTNVHDNSGVLLAGDVMASIGVLLFAAPLLFLFLATAARTERVQRIFIALAVLGPLLLAVQGVIRSVALADIADQFVAQEPSVEREAADGDTGTGSAGAEGGTGGTTGTDAAGTETTATDTTGTETTGDGGGSEADDPREKLADDLIDDSGTYQFASTLLFPGIFAMVFGMIYIPLWCMRTGLLTRFWATLGMALGVTLVLLPFAQLGLMIWFAAVGLLLVGAWPGGRPPAWAAGEAIPWPKAGEPKQPPPPDDTVEGSGRELSEPPLPEPPELEDGAGTIEVPDYPPEPGESQGRRRKKRKRRR